jgi:hypothetical protein
MTDKTEAMDNLIAQDADLIEICPDDLVQRLRSNRPIPTLPHEAADRIEAQAAEIEQWKVDCNELLLEVSKLRAALKNHSYTGKGWRAFKETYEALREKNDD